MVRFLSEAWLDEMAAAVRAVSEPTRADGGVPPLVVRQQVTGGPDGDIAYDLCLDDDGVTLRRPASGIADVVFEQDHETARRLAQGETHPQIELTAGRLRISGAANRLTAWRPMLDEMDEAMTDLRAVTTW